MSADPAPSGAVSRTLAKGEGWRLIEVICRSGPADRPFEEEHAWTSVSAVMSGVFTYRSAHGRALMSPGSLLLGNRGACFACGHEHGIGDRCVSFQVSPELAEETAGDLKGLRRSSFGSPRIPPLESLLPVLTELRELAGAPDPVQAEELGLRLFTAAFVLDGSADIVTENRDEARIASAVRIIDAQFAQPLSIARLAKAVGLRRRRLAGGFKRVVGVTPYNYILNRRLDAAAERLRSGQGTVLDVALGVGFGDLSEFTRRFKARFGQPPGAFRTARR
jgi:AraC-like DNA-binding protein